MSKLLEHGAPWGTFGSLVGPQNTFAVTQSEAFSHREQQLPQLLPGLWAVQPGKAHTQVAWTRTQTEFCTGVLHHDRHIPGAAGRPGAKRERNVQAPTDDLQNTFTNTEICILLLAIRSCPAVSSSGGSAAPLKLLGYSVLLYGRLFMGRFNPGQCFERRGMEIYKQANLSFRMYSTPDFTANFCL